MDSGIIHEVYISNKENDPFLYHEDNKYKFEGTYCSEQIICKISNGNRVGPALPIRYFNVNENSLPLQERNGDEFVTGVVVDKLGRIWINKIYSDEDNERVLSPFTSPSYHTCIENICSHVSIDTRHQKRKEKLIEQIDFHVSAGVQEVYKLKSVV